jgi:hypothetical protein
MERLHVFSIISLAASISFGFACSSSSGDTGAQPPPGDDVGNDAGPPPPAPAQDAGPPLEWNHTLGGGIAQAVTTNAAGEIFVAGSLYGHVDFGAGTVNPTADQFAFLAKYKSDGSLVWVKEFGGKQGMQSEWSLAADASGGVWVGAVVGGAANLGGAVIPLSFSGADSRTVLVAHFDTSGAHTESSPVLDCDGACGQAMVSWSDKGLALVASFSNNAQTPFVLGGTQEVYRGAGVIEHLRPTGGAPYTATNGTDGHVWGNFQTGGWVYTASTSATTSNLFAFTPDGQPKDQWTYNGADFVGLAIDDGERTFMSGSWNGGGTGDAFQLVQALGPTIEWAYGVKPAAGGDVRFEMGTVAWEKSSNTSVFAGNFHGQITIDRLQMTTKTPPPADDYDVFVIRYDHNGIAKGHAQLGGAGHDRVHGIALLPNGHVLVGGETDAGGWLQAIKL